MRTLVLTLIGEADVNQTTAMGETALHRICQCFDEKTMLPEELANEPGDSSATSILRRLIGHGGDVNRQDFYGMTPLHHACQNFSPYFVQILLENDADVSIKDSYNRTPLEYATLHDYKVANVLLQKASKISRQARIEAYELLALHRSCPDPYKSLLKATRLRRKYKVPKQVLPPLECYDYTKEWETFEELRAIEGDPEEVTIHALLARERILKGKHFNLYEDTHRDTIENTGLTNMRALQLHHMDLIEESGDYRDFGDSFVLLNSILGSFFVEDYPNMSMENDLVLTIVEFIFKSLNQIQEDLYTATKVGLIEQLISQFKQTMLFVTFFIVKLLQRSLLPQGGDTESVGDLNSANEQNVANTVSTPEADVTLAKEILRRVCKHFPVLVSPNSGYRAPLPHFMFDNQYFAIFIDHHYNKDYHLVLKLFLENRLDVDATDSDGNTLLHVVVGTSRIDSLLVKLLLEYGAHSHFRNKNLKTPLDIVKNPKINNSEEVIEMLEEHMKFFSLKCIAATKVRDYNLLPKTDDQCLPASLIKFVSMH